MTTGCGAHSCRDFSIARLLDGPRPFPAASRISVAPLDLRSSTVSGSSHDKSEERDVTGSWLRSADMQVWREGRLAADDEGDRQSSRHCCRHHARLLMRHECADDERPTNLCSSTVDDRRQMTYADPQQHHSDAHHIQGQYVLFANRGK